MDTKIDLLKEKASHRKNKKYFSMTSDTPDNLDVAKEVIDKYEKRFNRLGINIRVKDRR